MGGQLESSLLIIPINSQHLSCGDVKTVERTRIFQNEFDELLKNVRLHSAQSHMGSEVYDVG